MTTGDTNAQTPPQAPGPHPALKALDRLVGAWAISGPDGLTGSVTYEWMDGGQFLVQHVDLVQGGERTAGVEYIGYDKERRALTSHFFANSGDILEYVYQLDADTLTIWFGEVGSPAYFRGEFSDDGNTNTGRWVWPGGGYESTMTRTDR